MWKSGDLFAQLDAKENGGKGEESSSSVNSFPCKPRFLLRQDCLLLGWPSETLYFEWIGHCPGKGALWGRGDRKSWDGGKRGWWLSPVECCYPSGPAVCPAESHLWLGDLVNVFQKCNHLSFLMTQWGSHFLLVSVYIQENQDFMSKNNFAQPCS